MCIVEDSSCDFKDVNSLVFIGLIIQLGKMLLCSLNVHNMTTQILIIPLSLLLYGN